MARLGAGVSLLLYASLLVGQQQQLNRTFRSMTPGSLSMPMVAPLFLEDSDFSSTVTLANDAIAKMRARVVVLDSQGSQAAFKEVEMPGHTSLAVQINDLLAEAGSAVTSGSVLVIPEPMEGMPIGAQLSITSRAGATPAYIEEEMLTPDEGRQGVYRGAALNVKGSPIIALKSMGQASQSVTLECFAEKTAPTKGTVQLLPGDLLLVAACDPTKIGRTAVAEQIYQDESLPNRGSVGVSVTTTATPGSLMAFGFAVYKDEHGPYFSSLNLTNPTEARSSNIIFTGIPVGPANLFPGTTFHPEVAISNFSAMPAQVTVTLAHTIVGKTSAELVQKLTLAAHSSKTVQIPAHGDPAMTNSLTVRSSLPPGEVVAQFVAWGDSSIRTVEMQAKDNDSPQNGGGHPWSTEGGTNSTLFLFNHSSASARKIDVQISNGKELWRKSYLLASMQTEAVSINDIVANAIPDDEGHVLSKGAREGQIAWLAGLARWGKGRLMMSRPQEGLARSFSCATCTSDCANATLSPNSSLTVPVGGQGPLGNVIVHDCAINCRYPAGCGSTPVGLANLTYIQWQSQTSNIAQYEGGRLMATIKGMSPGLGTITVSAQDDNGQNYQCMASGGGQVTVQPTISGPNTVWWFNEENPDATDYPVSVTLKSSGGSSTSWSVTQADAKVILSSTSGAQITVTSSGTHFSGSVGDVSVTAKANGVSSVPFAMTARTPWELVSRGAPQTSCYSSPETYTSTVSYDLHDNLNGLMSSSVDWNEVLGAQVSENGSNWGSYAVVQSAGSTDPVQDMLAPPQLNVNPAPSPKPTCTGANSGTTRYRSIPQNISVGTVGNGAGVHVQSDTLGYYVDHGQHDSIQIPSQPPQ